MISSSKSNFLSVFITLSLGGIIYLVVSNGIFSMYSASIDHKAATLIGLLAAFTYYVGIATMMIIYNFFPNFK